MMSATPFLELATRPREYPPVPDGGPAFLERVLRRRIGDIRIPRRAAQRHVVKQFGDYRNYPYAAFRAGKGE